MLNLKVNNFIIKEFSKFINHYFSSKKNKKIYK